MARFPTHGMYFYPRVPTHLSKPILSLECWRSWQLSQLCICTSKSCCSFGHCRSRCKLLLCTTHASRAFPQGSSYNHKVAIISPKPSSERLFWHYPRHCWLCHRRPKLKAHRRPSRQGRSRRGHLPTNFHRIHHIYHRIHHVPHPLVKR